jgi:hypothetical protein
MGTEGTNPFDSFKSEDLMNLRRAAALLEAPGFFIHMTNWLGTPVEAGLKRLPQGAQAVIQDATHAALTKALDLALATLDPGSREESSNWLHKLAVGATGAAGGFFGLAGLAVELPVSTGIMLRSIADVARSEGENLHEVESRLACLEVFAFGGRSDRDDASESSYLIVRALLAREIVQSVEYLAERGLAKESGPVLLRLITRIAQRFGVQVGEKAAAEALPILGAVGGATLNLLFMDHFQDMARGHFIYRRLERNYGAMKVELAYRQILSGQ